MRTGGDRASRLLAGVAVLGALLLAAPVAGDTLPGFVLQNWDGRTITDDNLLGRITVVAFSYAKCVFACPLLTFLLQQLDEDLGSPPGVDYLHVSVNPAEDTREEILLHWEKHSINPETDPRWMFLNGPETGINELLASLDIDVEKKDLVIGDIDGWIIDHTIRVLVVGPSGEIRKTFDTFHWNPEEMQNAIQPSSSEH